MKNPDFRRKVLLTNIEKQIGDWENKRESFVLLWTWFATKGHHWSIQMLSLWEKEMYLLSATLFCIITVIMHGSYLKGENSRLIISTINNFLRNFEWCNQDSSLMKYEAKDSVWSYFSCTNHYNHIHFSKMVKWLDWDSKIQNMVK